MCIEVVVTLIFSVCQSFAFPYSLTTHSLITSQGIKGDLLHQETQDAAGETINLTAD